MILVLQDLLGRLGVHACSHFICWPVDHRVIYHDVLRLVETFCILSVFKLCVCLALGRGIKLTFHSFFEVLVVIVVVSIVQLDSIYYDRILIHSVLIWVNFLHRMFFLWILCKYRTHHSICFKDIGWVCPREGNGFLILQFNFFCTSLTPWSAFHFWEALRHLAGACLHIEHESLRGLRWVITLMLISFDLLSLTLCRLLWFLLFIFIQEFKQIDLLWLLLRSCPRGRSLRLVPLLVSTLASSSTMTSSLARKYWWSSHRRFEEFLLYLLQCFIKLLEFSSIYIHVVVNHDFAFWRLNLFHHLNLLFQMLFALNFLDYFEHEQIVVDKLEASFVILIPDEHICSLSVQLE